MLLGRASDRHPQMDAGTVWGYDPAQQVWTVLPARNQGDNMLARQGSCGGIAAGYGGSRVMAFGGDTELSVFDRSSGAHDWASDELWQVAPTRFNTS